MVPIVAGLLMGAAMGGGIAALQKKDILQGALMGGVGGALGGAFMPGIAGAAGSEAVASTTASALGDVGATELMNQGLMNTAGNLTQTGAAQFMGSNAGFQAAPGITDGVTGAISGGSIPVPPVTPPSGIGNLFSGGIGDFVSNNKYALAGGALGGMMAPGQEPDKPDQGNIREFEYSRGEVNPLFGQPGQSYYTGGGYTPGAVTPVEDYMANGGIIALAEGGDVDRYTRPTRTVDPAVAAYNAQIMERANQQYNVNMRPGPNQVPGSAGYVAPPVQQQTPQAGQVGGLTYNRQTGLYEGELNPLDGKKKRPMMDMDDDLQEPYYNSSAGDSGNANGGRITQRYNDGGLSSLGSYSDGGQLLKGPGDGVSDSIPATIEGRQPARLANDEFVVPARIVSELGNGSTDAGARQLYKMMDRVQNARKKSIGKGKVAVDTKAHRMLPA
jgi:hypothetical protein